MALTLPAPGTDARSLGHEASLLLLESQVSVFLAEACARGLLRAEGRSMQGQRELTMPCHRGQPGLSQLMLHSSP